MLLGALFYRQRLNLGQSLLLSLTGVLTLVLQGRWSQWRQIQFVPGDALMLTAMLCFALYTLWLRQLPADLDRIGLMATQILIALLVLLPFWLIEHALTAAPAWTVNASAALLYVGIFPSVLAYLLYMRAVQHFGTAWAGVAARTLPEHRPRCVVRRRGDGRIGRVSRILSQPIPSTPRRSHPRRNRR